MRAPFVRAGRTNTNEPLSSLAMSMARPCCGLTVTSHKKTPPDHRRTERTRERDNAMRKLNLLAGMALAALVLIGLTATADKTGANFTATSTNQSNTFGSATLTMSNNKPNANDLVNVTNLVPGDTMNRTVTITNTGNAGFTYSGAISAVANTTLWSDLVKM